MTDTSKFNGLAIAPSTGTLAIANGKTVTINNTITITATDGITLNLDLVPTKSAANTFSAAQVIQGGLTIAASAAATQQQLILGYDAVNEWATIQGVHQTVGFKPIFLQPSGSYVFCGGGLFSKSPTAGVGYMTGAGGAVTQITSRATGVTLNKICGKITTDSTSLAAGTHADFVVTNSAVAVTDVIVASVIPGGTGSPRVSVVSVAAGSFTLRVTNDHASTADTSADIINFAVLKSVVA